MLLRDHMQRHVEGMVPDLHIILLSDNAMLHRFLLGQVATLALDFISHGVFFLAQEHCHALVPGVT